jgi:hypothetical protein
MKVRLLGLAVVLPLLLGGGDPKAGLKFKEFAPKGAGFSVMMPGEPKEQKKSVKTPAGDVEITMNVAEPAANYTFVIAHTDYPEAALKNSSEDQRLDAYRDAAVREVKGKIINEKKIKLAKFPGRDVVIELSPKGQLHARFYVVDNRLYQLTVGGTKEQASSKDAEKFLDSFKLTRK